jgi:hypothetical protein
MNIKSIKNELQNILSGTSGYSYDAVIQAVTNYLRTSQRTSPMAESKHKNRAEETARLIEFATKNDLFYDDIDESQYISQGAEQKVYIKENKYVIKLNDAIYYASWEDYFHNLLLHNYFFADTAYQLLGFYQSENTLYAVVKQHYVNADKPTDLTYVKGFLESNGFTNTKNHDYYHADLGIILEDLHDENVLTKQGILYFIDTVFYVKPTIFWSK